MAAAAGDRQRLHQLPAGEVGRAEVAQLAGAHQAVERGQGFLHRRHRIEVVQLQQVDVVRAEPLQRLVDRGYEMRARRADKIGRASWREREGKYGEFSVRAGDLTKK